MSDSTNCNHEYLKRLHQSPKHPAVNHYHCPVCGGMFKAEALKIGVSYGMPVESQKPEK